MQAASGNAGEAGALHPVKDAPLPPANHGDDMHRGWVKLWRKWRDHEMASDPNATLVFLHLLTEARREPKVNRRYGYTVDRGQCDLTQDQLSKLTGLSRKSVREALLRLGRYGTITVGQQKGRQPSIITISNFDTYNPDGPDNGQQNGQQRATVGANKGPLPEKEEKTTTTKRARARAEIEVVVPDDLLPFKTAVEDWLAYKRERGQAYKPRGLGALWATCRKLGSGLPDAVAHSMANNYAGLFAANGQAKPADQKVSLGNQRGRDSSAYGDA